MSQQPLPTDSAIITTVAGPLVPIMETLNRLVQEVHDLPAGGDLEGLIESYLAGLDRQCLALALLERQRAAERRASEKSEAFSPCGLSQVSDALAPRAQQAAHDPDPAR